LLWPHAHGFVRTDMIAVQSCDSREPAPACASGPGASGLCCAHRLGLVPEYPRARISCQEKRRPSLYLLGYIPGVIRYEAANQEPNGVKIHLLACKPRAKGRPSPLTWQLSLPGGLRRASTTSPGAYRSRLLIARGPFLERAGGAVFAFATAVPSSTALHV
jgi:hypothetical protein